jgi:APA family basic amino acid/polyamine antiporter
LFFNTIIARPREAAIGMILILSGIPVFYLLQWKYSKKNVMGIEKDNRNGNI